MSERTDGLGDLQVVALRPSSLERGCKRCGQPFVPLHGKWRLYCYLPECERARDREKGRKARERVQAKKKTRGENDA